MRPLSSGNGTSTVPLQLAFDSLDLDNHGDHNEVLVQKVNSQDQSSLPVPQDAVDVLNVGRDRDTPLSKLLDAFIEKIDSEVLIKAGQCLSSTEVDKELDMSLCSVDIDVFPLDDEDANFGLSFTDLVENSSASIDYDARCRKVKFAPEKDIVFEIPSHRALTEQERLEMYNNSDAIRLQAFRNYAEWVWEGCDIANVVEEDKFCTGSDGNLLHPAHCDDENRPSANTE